MARVAELQRVTKQRQTVHERIEAAVSVFTSDSGEKYVQIDTYGSKERKRAGEINQSIQLEKSAAAQLKAIIEETFPDLR